MSLPPKYFFILTNTFLYIVEKGQRKITFFKTIIWVGVTIGTGPVPVAARSKALVCGRSPAETVGSDPAEDMDVLSVVSVVLSGRGLCDGLITHAEESYRLWCVHVCDLETSRMRRPRPALGCSTAVVRDRNKKKNASYGFQSS